MSIKVISGKKLWTVSSGVSSLDNKCFCCCCYLDGFPKSLALACAIFHWWIFSCVILNLKCSISSSLNARVTRIHLAKPCFLILIF